MTQPVDLYSPLAPEAIARKLKAIMEDPMTDAKARVFGGGTQYAMTLRYVRRNFRSNMTPTLKAEMTPHGAGTRITGTIATPALARYFPCLWFAFLSIFVVIGVAVTAFVPDMLLFGAIFVGVPVLMMAIGGLVFYFAPSTDEDGADILAFLKRELDARPMTGQS